jgi:hypothetical protein
MFATMDVIPSITVAGILDFDQDFTSDHRAMCINVQIEAYFQGMSVDPVSLRLEPSLLRIISASRERKVIAAEMGETEANRKSPNHLQNLTTTFK